MTANLLVDRADLAHLSDVLSVVDPDVLLVQELGPSTADLLAARFSHHDLRPQLDARGRGIATRFEADFGVIPLPWRSGMWTGFAHGADRWLIGNLHARNPIVFPWWRSVRIRARQLDALFSWADRVVGDHPFVLAGDMNASPAWPLYRRLATRWPDVVAGGDGRDMPRPSPTWGWRPGWPRLLRIDHVFGGGVRAVATQVVPLRRTDHAAVVVDLVSIVRKVRVGEGAQA